ncbi:MAG: RNA 2'-phosphotransferase [Bacteroidota bacterium]
MNQKHIIKTSKFLSLVLRHKPQVIDAQLDPQGWIAVDTLLEKLAQAGRPLSRAELETIVRENNKKRFAFSEDGRRIRASQGHSISVELAYVPQEPPAMLYHGTAERFLESIFTTGLTKQRRHHVHLSAELATASQVGSRHGKLVILEVDSQAMQEAGHTFYCSENGVWLTEEVPVQYLKRQA